MFKNSKVGRLEGGKQVDTRIRAQLPVAVASPVI